LKDGPSFQEGTAYQYLTAIQYCTYILLNAMPGDDVNSVMNVGIYGVAIKKDKVESRLIYINGYASERTKTVEEVIQFLPPAFTSKAKDISPVQAKLSFTSAITP
jgi:hypothetical protein